MEFEDYKNFKLSIIIYKLYMEDASRSDDTVPLKKVRKLYNMCIDTSIEI